jgi:hypothetical protein
MENTSALKRVAGEYYANVCALQDRRCTVEQHRAENARLKGLVTETQWEQAKMAAFASLERSSVR